jgi:hypothetical protein
MHPRHIHLLDWSMSVSKQEKALTVLTTPKPPFFKSGLASLTGHQQIICPDGD